MFIFTTIMTREETNVKRGIKLRRRKYLKDIDCFDGNDGITETSSLVSSFKAIKASRNSLNSVNRFNNIILVLVKVKLFILLTAGVQST
jgi:hypothetical protein